MMGRIFNVFGPSPIRPLEQHMRKVHLCAKQLLPFFNAVLTQNWVDAARIQGRIVKLEREADTMKRDLRLNLPNGLFIPVSRTTLLEVLRAQDKIANKAEDIAELMVSREMHIPDNLAPLISIFVHRAVDAAKQACDVINELDELLESGFRGSEVKVVEKMVMKLDEIEHDCDDRLTEIRKEIFRLEKTLSPIDIIFLYKLVQWIGELADLAQTVGMLLQILIAR